MITPWKTLFPRWPEDFIPTQAPPIALFEVPPFDTDVRYRRFKTSPFESSTPLPITVVGEPQVRGDESRWTYRCERPAIEVAVSARRMPDLDVGVLQARITSRASRPVSFRWMHYAFEMRGTDRWSVQSVGGGGKAGIYPPRSYARSRVTMLEHDYVFIDTDESAASSNTALPIMSAWRDRDPHQHGLWFGLEWSGAWLLSADRQRGADSLRFEAGVKVDGLTMEPGEVLEMPALYIGLFEGGADGATNSLRRYLYQEHLPDYMGERPYPRVSYDQWNGLRDDVSMATMAPQVERAAEIGVEMWCLDAGWFGPYPQTCGDWHRAAPDRFPDGLEPLAELVRSKGMDFGLWFGPERAYEGTWAFDQHPELYWRDPGGGAAAHLNLARRDAQDWLIELMSGWIERLDLRWSRWDCNLAPGRYWQEADPTGRIQFAYVAGLYRVLDVLRERHPQWMIESCASGGRRIDLGTLRRSHTNWFSDSTINPAICRWMQLRSQLVLPGCAPNSSVAVMRGAGDPGDIDEAVLSRFCGKLAFDGDIASLSEAGTRRVRHWTDHYKRLRHLLVQDFHQLSPIPGALDEPDIVAFRSYDGSEALMAAFLPEQAPTDPIDVLPAAQLDAWSWTDLTSGDPASSGLVARPRLDGRAAAMWHGTS